MASALIYGGMRSSKSKGRGREVWDWPVKMRGGWEVTKMKDLVKKKNRGLYDFFKCLQYIYWHILGKNIYFTDIYWAKRCDTPFSPLLKSCISPSQLQPFWPPVTFISQVTFFCYFLPTDNHTKAPVTFSWYLLLYVKNIVVH